MKVEQILERMDVNIKLLNESIEQALTLTTADAKRKYGSIKTYNECVNMERGAVSSMISLRQWIVNRCAGIKHLEQYKEYSQLN